MWISTIPDENPIFRTYHSIQIKKLNVATKLTEKTVSINGGKS